MAFMEGGTKRVNTFTTVNNQQQAIQGSGNFAVSGTVNTGGGDILFQSLDPLALSAMERTANAAIMASAKYVEFASESNIRGLEANAGVAQMAIGTGMTPDQIAAAKGSGQATEKTFPTEKVLVGLAVVGLIMFGAKKFF